MTHKGTSIAGIDGAKNKTWIAILQDLESGRVWADSVEDLAELLLPPNAPILSAIDIPIGLSESGSRACDVQARAMLKPRGSCVFPAPLRAAVKSPTRAHADAISRSIQGKGVPAQAFGIYPRIDQVDELLTANPRLQSRVFEIHPELCFATWNRSPLHAPKKSSEGREMRKALVSAHFGASAFDQCRSQCPRNKVADDDILDAFAALWTAQRIHTGTAKRIPENLEKGDFGMAMWY